MSGYSRYIARRVLYMAFTLLVIISLNFILFRIMPGDPVAMIIDPGLPLEARERLRDLYGLDEPLGLQYLMYLRNMATFQFGTSFTTRRPVASELMERLPNTVYLLGTAMALTIFFGVTLGIFAASREGTWLDTAVIGAGITAGAVPTFFIQLLAMLLFCYFIPIFPVRGTMPVPPPTGFWAVLAGRLYHMILPVSTLVLATVGSWALYTRNSMMEALGQDFVLTARAKGIHPRRVFYAHVFRSVLPPIITVVFLALPGIMTGAVITEIIFSWHGIGKYMLDSLMEANYPGVQAVFYLLALAVLVCNFLADLAYGFVDPRIKAAGEG